jgi:hypothetical protein
MDRRDYRKSRQQFLLAYYRSTRGEIVQRIATRDVALTIFLGAVAALLGVAVNGQPWVLFLVPVFGLGASSLRANHVRAIYRATDFLCSQYREEVAALYPNPDPSFPQPYPTFWDLWQVRYLSLPLGMGEIANVSMILVPQIVALVLAGLKIKINLLECRWDCIRCCFIFALRMDGERCDNFPPSHRAEVFQRGNTATRWRTCSLKSRGAGISAAVHDESGQPSTRLSTMRRVVGVDDFLLDASAGAHLVAVPLSPRADLRYVISAAATELVSLAEGPSGAG